MSGATFEVEAAARGDLGGVVKGAAPAAGDKTALDVSAELEKDPALEITEEVLHGPNGEVYPTKEDLLTLRRVHGHTSWVLYTIG